MGPSIYWWPGSPGFNSLLPVWGLSLIHISEPTRQAEISYAVFTGDNHYAKILIVSLNASDFGYTVRVAYQPQTGNNELKPGLPGHQ